MERGEKYKLGVNWIVVIVFELFSVTSVHLFFDRNWTRKPSLDKKFRHKGADKRVSTVQIETWLRQYNYINAASQFMSKEGMEKE